MTISTATDSGADIVRAVFEAFTNADVTAVGEALTSGGDRARGIGQFAGFPAGAAAFWV